MPINYNSRADENFALHFMREPKNLTYPLSFQFISLKFEPLFFSSYGNALPPNSTMLNRTQAEGSPTLCATIGYGGGGYGDMARSKIHNMGVSREYFIILQSQY